MTTMDRESAEIGGEDGRMDSNSPSWPASRGRKSRKIYTHSRVTDVTAKIDRQRDSPSRAKQQQHGQGQGQGQGTGQGRGCSHANHGERLMGGHVNSRIAVAAGCDVVHDGGWAPANQSATHNPVVTCATAGLRFHQHRSPQKTRRAVGQGGSAFPRQ
jgi:hypothetical protein